MVYRVCFIDELNEDYSNSEEDSLSLPTLVTVQEAKMQAAIINACSHSVYELVKNNIAFDPKRSEMLQNN